MFVLSKVYYDLLELSNHRAERIAYLEQRNEELELHNTWADGEIEFWMDQCRKAEDQLHRINGVYEERFGDETI